MKKVEEAEDFRETDGDVSFLKLRQHRRNSAAFARLEASGISVPF